MENTQRSNDKNRNRNRNRNNDNRGNNKPSFRKERQERPQRRRRVAVDRNAEVIVTSNVIGQFYYENPRMSMIIDLEKIGDEEYITVGDLRAILNSNRKIIEGFQLIITDVADSEYTLEDVLVYLGLDKKYDEFYSLSKRGKDGQAEVTDIKNFILNSPITSFESTMAKIDEKLRTRVIEASVVLFKLKEFGDYNKMRVIEEYVNEELFLDARETEIEPDVYI